jgi:ketosteroid isomerase-like protein
MGFAEDYIDAWNSADVDRFVGQFAPDGCYTDVTMELTYDGESELRRMFSATMSYYQKPQFIFTSGFSDDTHYVAEWTSITEVEGSEYTTHVVSIGDLDERGRITENRDYWNPQTVPNHGDMSVEAAAYERRKGERRKAGKS